MSEKFSSSRRADVAIMLPDLRGGGAERVNINLANELVLRGYEVDMVLMRAVGQLLPMLDRRVRVVELKAARMRNALLPLLRYMRRSPPLSTLACMWPLSVIAIAAHRLCRLSSPMVVAEHTTWSVAERDAGIIHRTLVRTTMRFAFPHASAVVAVSNGAADDLAMVARLERGRVTTIYNPIVGGAKSGEVASQVDFSEWAHGDHRRILAVGTLKEIKDYATLLKAFTHLRKHVNAKLLVLGEGDQRRSLERLVSELGIGGYVFMPGFVTDTAPYYGLADLHVLSSKGEGLPTVIVEALENGVPVVSTDCPSGPREILDGGRFGALVPVGDAVALSDAMRVALTTSHDTSALKRRAADFSVAAATDSYLDLLIPFWRHSAESAEGV